MIADPNRNEDEYLFRVASLATAVKQFPSVEFGPPFKTMRSAMSYRGSGIAVIQWRMEPKSVYQAHNHPGYNGIYRRSSRRVPDAKTSISSELRRISNPEKLSFPGARVGDFSRNHSKTRPNPFGPGLANSPLMTLFGLVFEYASCGIVHPLRCNSWTRLAGSFGNAVGERRVICVSGDWINTNVRINAAANSFICD